MNNKYFIVKAYYRPLINGIWNLSAPFDIPTKTFRSLIAAPSAPEAREKFHKIRPGFMIIDVDEAGSAITLLSRVKKEVSKVFNICTFKENPEMHEALFKLMNSIQHDGTNLFDPAPPFEKEIYADFATNKQITRDEWITNNCHFSGDEFMPPS